MKITKRTIINGRIAQFDITEQTVSAIIVQYSVVNRIAISAYWNDVACRGYVYIKKDFGLPTFKRFASVFLKSVASIASNASIFDLQFSYTMSNEICDIYINAFKSSVETYCGIVSKYTIEV